MKHPKRKQQQQIESQTSPDLVMVIEKCLIADFFLISYVGLPNWVYYWVWFSQ